MPNQILQTQQMDDLLRRMRAGDNEAREEFLLRVCGRLEILARKMLKGFPVVKRWFQTGDVLNNALIRLLKTLKNLHPDSMRGFYSLAAEHIRRELVDLARNISGPEGIGANHHSNGLDDSRTVNGWEPAEVCESVDEVEKWCSFHQAVEKLPVDQREIVSLIYYHGWTQAQVAELFQVTDRTIRRRWQEALLTLREALQGSLPTP